MKQAAIFLLLIIPICVSGQTYTSTTTGGGWNTGSTWVGGAAPTNWSDYTANIYGNINVNQLSVSGFTAINLYDGKTFNRGTSGTSSHLTMQSVGTFTIHSGSITIYGDLTLDNTDLVITSGSLTVKGTLTIRNGGSLTTSSGVTTTVAAYTSSNHSTSIFNNGGTATITGDATPGGPINNTGTMSIGGNLTSPSTNTSVLTNGGTLSVTGNVTYPSDSKIQINPGGQTFVYGNVTLGQSGTNLTVGTNVAPPPYADFAVKGDLTAGSDLLLNQNARFAVFGNMSGTGGDSDFVISNGAQAYVGGNLTYSGGSSDITNSNTLSPYGLYVNGTTTNTGGGATTTTNRTNRSTMESTNVPFTSWVNSAYNTLPIKLSHFRVSQVNDDQIILAWRTSSEINTDRFVIERSADGKDFYDAAEVKAEGGFDLDHNYAWVDSQPLMGRSYYRLKSIDFDGYTERFNIVVAEFAGARKIMLYPNPAKGNEVNLSLNFTPMEFDYATIVDNVGLEISKIKVTEINSRIIFDSRLKPGIYHLRYLTSGQLYQSRFVVE